MDLANNPDSYHIYPINTKIWRQQNVNREKMSKFAKYKEQL